MCGYLQPKQGNRALRGEPGGNGEGQGDVM